MRFLEYETWRLKKDCPRDAYDNMSGSTQNRIAEALKGGIKYGEGIDYPYAAGSAER